MNRRRQPVWVWALPLALMAAAFTLASLLRFQLIEPSLWGPICAAALEAKTSNLECSVRELTITFFSFNRLAWLALGTSIAALALKNQWLALLSLSLASAGLVLYSALWCAPAFWLALLAYQKAHYPHKDPQAAQA